MGFCTYLIWLFSLISKCPIGGDESDGETESEIGYIFQIFPV